MMSPEISAEDIEILHDFIEESSDMIEQLEPIIIELGRISRSADDWLETMNAIFRLFHSMKGSAGFLELTNIQGVAHSAENLLDLVRSDKISLQQEHVHLLCQACDFAKAALEEVGQEYTDQGMEDQARFISEALRESIERALAGPADAVQATVEYVAVDTSPAEELSFEMIITPEMQDTFCKEAEELIEKIEQGFLSWEDVSNGPEMLAELFRNIHSLKGNCGFLGYKDLEILSHRVETVLAGVKEGESLVGEKPDEVFLQVVDVLREAIAAIVDGGKGDISGLPGYIALLQGITRRPLGQILIDEGIVTEEQVREAIDHQEIDRENGMLPRPIGEELIDMGVVAPAEVATALVRQKERTQPPVDDASTRSNAGKKKAVVRQDIRVDLDKLDSLINLIGEMVIAENMLIHNPDLAGLEMESFTKAAQQMRKLVKELQEMAMQIRMIPVSGLFRKMIRLVHDLSAKSGKKVDLQLIGEETELDKTVIETITDPLVHILRNSLDHGLEPPEERLRTGKDQTGTLVLSARHEEGEIWITISDDGRGLNRDKIIAKAISSGLIEGDGSDLSDDKVFRMIFQAGLSTAEKITDISGRGVGMDVVKQNLAKIRGKVDVHSTLGKGTRVDLRIPLTLAIIDGMLVRVGQEKCIVPILAIKESFRPTAKDITLTPSRDELIRVRESFYPTLRLHKVLGKEPDSTRLEEGILIVLENHGTTICLFVDEILGQQQTVIKGLSDYIGNPAGIAGCTILGNGDVCLILDVGGL
ncbi:MAG: chemotaxis protein CheA, partial [Desulfoprunum sp.]|nr:chemotaxis protein CheA [Desulfoprunum sp.]